MNILRTSFVLSVVFALTCLSASAQTAGNEKQFIKDGLTFDYPSGWTLTDDSNKDAQQLSLARPNNDVQIRVFVHRGKATAAQIPEAKKAFIDPYIQSTAKQFISMGAKPTETPDSTEISGVKADGVAITASLGGEPGAAKIYWTLVGNRIVMLTYFGPDKELKQFVSAWDAVRGSIQIATPAAAPKPGPAASPKPSPQQ